MPIRLKIVDRGRLVSEDLAEHIRERTEKLGHFFGRVKQCHVTVDGPDQHPLRGRIRVRIRIHVPDSEIVIDRQAGATLPIAVRESFDAADQRLEDYVRLGRQSVKTAKRRQARLRAAD